MIVPGSRDKGIARKASFAWAAAFLLLALFVAGDYGPTWDTSLGEFPYGDWFVAKGLGEVERPVASWHEDLVPLRQPHPAFYGDFYWYQIQPLTAVLSGLSCRLFWDGLGMIPALPAHRLPQWILLALLLAVLVRWAAPRLGLLSALLFPVFLLGSPRFFAHAFQNAKDIVECALYSFAVLAGFTALRRGGPRAWMSCGVLSGFALAAKPNAFFLPFQGLFFALPLLLRRGRREALPGLSWKGLGSALLAALLAFYLGSPDLWARPIEGAWTRFREILDIGSALTTVKYAGLAEESAKANLNGLLHVATALPIPLQVCALYGILRGRLPPFLRWFLLSWMLFPILRVSLPGMRDFDGFRHFLEFHPPLSLFGALGFAGMAGDLGRLCGGRLRPAARGLALLVLSGLVFGPMAYARLRWHPDGIAWYDAWIGGLGGAQRRELPEATDYWGNSYWRGLRWLEAHVEPEAVVCVPICGHVAWSAAPVRIRRRLRFVLPKSEVRAPVLYVMYITRLPFYRELLSWLHAWERQREGRWPAERGAVPKPPYPAPVVREWRVQGGPILRIRRIAGEEAVRDALRRL